MRGLKLRGVAKMTEKKDKFRRVKFMGFCMSQLPPDGFSLDFEDYMNWILFQLCKHYKIPTKSDVWDKYTDEIYPSFPSSLLPHAALTHASSNSTAFS